MEDAVKQDMIGLLTDVIENASMMIGEINNPSGKNIRINHYFLQMDLEKIAVLVTQSKTEKENIERS